MTLTEFPTKILTKDDVKEWATEVDLDSFSEEYLRTPVDWNTVSENEVAYSFLKAYVGSEEDEYLQTGLYELLETMSLRTNNTEEQAEMVLNLVALACSGINTLVISTHEINQEYFLVELLDVTHELNKFKFDLVVYHHFSDNTTDVSKSYIKNIPFVS